ncbi:MAG: carbohydrate binding family 9 domain-containing protein [Candidatus Aminicenantes bacterium]|nr:MAG: carbohydrate binding family 9 domain-containing protein [Candidatus Aminicenantes bacterium]
MDKSTFLARVFFVFLYFCLALVFSLPIWSEKKESPKLPYAVPEAGAKVKIDGILDDKAWEEALVLELKYEVEPGENIAPPVRTEALLTSSSNFLYAAFRAYDPNPSQIRARITDRDKIWHDDYVGIVLDTFNDSRLSYNFYCNPYGVQAEKIIGFSGYEIQWDAIWDSAGRVTPEGYVVEMSIPFSVVRFQRREGEQVWGIDLIRSYPRNLPHEIGLFPRDRDNNCYMCQANKIIGFKWIKPGKNIELDPTLTGVLTQEREDFPEGKFDDKTRQVNPGMTARWRFTPNLTLSAAVNPDFSNVEADYAQLDVNNQFILFYPEKRPFFLEDGNIFESIYYVIHTRTIVEPNFGIKLTGKEGGHSIGFFSLQDNQTSFAFPWSQGSISALVNMKNISTVLRYRGDVGKSSAVGFLVTDREGDDYFNRVVGVDARWKFTPKDKILFQYLYSWTHYPGQVAAEYEQPTGTLKDSALALNYQHVTQKWGFITDYQRVTPFYRHDLGVNDQANYQYLRSRLRYSFRRNPGHWFTNLFFACAITRQYTVENPEPLYKDIRFKIIYQGPLQTYLDSLINFGKRWYLGKEFDEKYVSFQAGLHPSASLYLGLDGIIGDQVDFTNVQQGNRVHLNPIIEYKWGKHLMLRLDHIFERLNVDAGRLYTANLSNFLIVYQFNRRLFLRTILQYAHYDRNPELYTTRVDPKYRHLFSQVLLSYKINPQTVLFLGYSDDHYGYQQIYQNQYLHIPLTQSNRTFFLKIGYALVM